MSLPILEAKDLLWKVKGKTIVRVNRFQICPGEHVALIGPNGSGKSTLIKFLAFLQKPSAGEIVFQGIGPNSSIIYKRRQMAVVFQEPLLLNMNVYDNIAYGLKLRKANINIRERVDYWLDKLSISHLKSRYPKNLSGGEAQRTSIARALALEPKILFLDEPFTALDAPTKAQLLEEMNLLIRQSSITSIFITHDFSEIPFMADKVYVMSEGEIVQQGPLEDIFYRPVNEVVASLVGADNQYEVTISERYSSNRYGIRLNRSHTNLVVHTAVPKNFISGQRLKAFIRSDDIGLGAELENKLDGYVKKISPHGFQYKVLLDCGFELSVVISKQQFIELNLKNNDRLTVSINSKNIHLIETS
ncbi:MAG: ABC transporter ATP-binding protein [Clostridia bacterium]|jgi:tungstate transport system ATP-binding protein|nr:ABC transporter ATP-binding protein [Clostridia bacterium]